MPGGDGLVLSRAEWTARRISYRDRVAHWVADRADRGRRQTKHPVYDFLFEYYSFPPSHLLRWSPGFGVALDAADAAELDWPRWYSGRPTGPVIPGSAYPGRRRDYLRWAIAYLDTTGRRDPAFGCFGLHEWAMVYRTDRVRHDRLPLRLSRAATDGVVDAGVVRCTHYDAYRFFTPAAVPRNRSTLSRATTTDHDQPGCVHVTMDLYKFAYKVAPFLPAELTADAFELALAARELDMRASPYDLSGLGFDPIPIETKPGREEYVERQRSLYRDGAPVRERILGGYRDLLASLSPKEIG